MTRIYEITEEVLNIYQEALEKQKPKNPIKKIFRIEHWYYTAQAEFYSCPTCGQRVEVDDNEGYLTEYYPTCECGQRIDWNGVIPNHHMKWLEKPKEWRED